MTLWVAGTNAWIVAPDGTDECIVVDVPPEPDRLRRRLDELGLRPAVLLLTHGHVDHVGGVGTLVRAVTPAPTVLLHGADLPLLQDPVGTSGQLGALLAASGLDTRPPEVVQSPEDGEEISALGLRFRSLHTPGHTPGSTCFLLEPAPDQRVLFSGDHLFAGSIGRTDLPGGSLPDLLRSMEEQILPLPDDVRVLPGHGPTTTVGVEREHNPYLAGLRRRRVVPGWTA
jgi:glyoxylase-like metal-dependent hydrolase (beta-lactamase superfamily II)